MACYNGTEGIIFRNGCKDYLIGNPPLPGEMVFADDTGEHGWLDENGDLVWIDLTVDNEVSTPIYRVCQSPHVFSESTNWETING